MSKKSISQKKTQREQQENKALQQIFNVFLTGLAAECYLLIVYRGYIAGTIDSLLVWDKILRASLWLGLILVLGGLAVAVWKRNDAKLRKVATVVTALGGFLAFSGGVMSRFFSTGVVAMCTIVPVVTVLGLVYFLYQRECFVSTVLLAASLFTVWVCDKGLDGSWKTLVLLGSVAVVIFLAAAAFVVRKLQNNDGKFRDIEVFSEECDYRIVYAVCGVCVAAVLAVMVMPSTAFYLTWALVIALFAVLAYYTTKMM
ncbi:MAG: hypothetical protein IJ955_01015 [Oscillospiraceae bacterium]|nr:hypothetical protein [Oscillospiraceae bacterium]